ncbi:MAG TPA: cadherin-like domain-containing protein [Acidimicrobiales bacterium]|nr:cadherin-like domain-containing protein [Acidimicrobiales bacterium]
MLANDVDPDGDTLSVSSFTAPGAGTAVLTNSGAISYTPKNGFKGIDHFTYTASDGRGGTATAMVRITVTNKP